MKPQKFKQTEIGEIPEDWDVKKFEKNLEVKGRIGWKGYARTDLVDAGPLVIGGAEIKSVRYLDLSQAKHILREKFEESPEIKLKDKDILLVTRGNLGYVGFFDKIIGEATINPSIVILSEFKENPLFLFYYLISPQGNNEVMNLRSGSSVPAIYQSAVKQLYYPSPPLPEQSAIASILSSLDAKIELNNQMNKTLEAIGQALFKRWFVDEAKDGWKNGFLGDGNLTEIIGSGIDKFDGEKIYIATADVENANIINYNTKVTFESRPSRANMALIPNSIWFAKMKESKKVFLVAPYNNLEMKNLIFSTGFTGLKVKPEALYYVWNFVNSNSFEILKDNLSIGTTMQGVNNDLIKRIKLTIPDQETLKRFNESVRSIYFRVYMNNLQNQSLAQIRDSLLPKLMSGQIRVE